MDVDATPIVTEDKIYVASYDGSLYAFKRQDGASIWELKDGSAYGATLEGDTLYYSSGEGYLYALDAKDANIKWRTKVKAKFLTKPVILENFIIAGSADRGLEVYKKQTGAFVTEYNTGNGIFSVPVIGDDQQIYTYSNFGVLYSFKLVNW